MIMANQETVHAKDSRTGGLIQFFEYSDRLNERSTPKHGRSGDQAPDRVIAQYPAMYP
jgi:hypothetical protein